MAKYGAQFILGLMKTTLAFIQVLRVRRTRSTQTHVMRVVVGLLLCFSYLLPPALARDESALLGLPVLAYPADNPPTPDKVRLGKQLFFDKQLSADHSISCASCHLPDHLFADGLPRSIGINRQIASRNAPSLINAAFNSSQFWDGRRSSLEEQALDPLINRREHGMASHEEVLKYVRGSPMYGSAFRLAFHVEPSAIQPFHVGAAIASYERTIVVGNSPFDRFYFKGEQSALSEQARQGLLLFQGKAQCISCHSIERAYALFTDNQFHSLNIGMKRIENRLAALTIQLAEQKANGANLGSLILDDTDIAELGRFVVTLEPTDIGAFRTPSLRNVALTAPYMHDGSIATLDDAVDYEIYYRSVQNGRPLILTPIEKLQLVEFLKALSSDPETLKHLEFSTKQPPR